MIPFHKLRLAIRAADVPISSRSARAQSDGDDARELPIVPSFLPCEPAIAAAVSVRAYLAVRADECSAVVDKSGELGLRWFEVRVKGPALTFIEAAGPEVVFHDAKSGALMVSVGDPVNARREEVACDPGPPCPWIHVEHRDLRQISRCIENLVRLNDAKHASFEVDSYEDCRGRIFHPARPVEAVPPLGLVLEDVRL